MEESNKARRDDYSCAREHMEKFIGCKLTHEFVKKIQALVIGCNITSAEYCTYRTGGSGPIVSNKAGVIVYCAPSAPNFSISIEMQELLDWDDENKLGLSSAELAARFHWAFVKIHPFDDGNGRTVRLLVSFMLLNAGYSNAVCRRLEVVFEKSKTAYYDALDDGKFSYDKRSFDRVSPQWSEYFQETLSCAMKNEQ